MLHLIHDVAPGSPTRLCLCVHRARWSSPRTSSPCARNSKADVSWTDVGLFDEPMYSDGMVSRLSTRWRRWRRVLLLCRNTVSRRSKIRQSYFLRKSKAWSRRVAVT